MLGSYDECMGIPGAHYCTMFDVKVNISKTKVKKILCKCAILWTDREIFYQCF